MTGPGSEANGKQPISVAELLARNGTIGEPAVTLHSGPGMAWAVWIPNNANGVEVHTTDATGQPADQRFVVTVL